MAAPPSPPPPPPPPRPVVNLYQLSKYTTGKKEPVLQRPLEERIGRMNQSYINQGIRITVEGILVVHDKSHPHVLLLRYMEGMSKLPGGRLRAGENEIEGLKRKLSNKLGSPAHNYEPNWQIGECVACWWRADFDWMLHPYCPTHITKPKECKKLFIVHLHEQDYFLVPENTDFWPSLFSSFTTIDMTLSSPDYQTSCPDSNS